ncbi:MAG: chaperone modulator CbpM [Candidatus Promineifilaceae bacterium]|nr:chaperone modulator CbpM [Candidatus Promineifilaceae bacterium]
MPNYLIIRSRMEEDDEQHVFTREMAAELARVTLDFLKECEREQLVRPGRLAGGGEGFTARDIHNLARIRRLRDDLGLNLAGVEVVLHMRQRMLELLADLERVERRMARREWRARREMRELRRRMAEEADWESD